MDFGQQNKPNGTSITTIVVIVVVAILCLVGGYIISTGTSLVFPDQASEESKQIDQLFRVMLFISGGLFLFVQGALVYSVLRYRTRQGDMSDGPTIHGNVTLELIWTVIPAVVVVFLVIYSYQTWTDIREPKDNEIVVNAIGQRYAWSFEHELPSEIYAGLDAEQQARIDMALVASSPNLHVYAGRPVRMVMHTQDVIHSFWVPTMRIKQDLLPGYTTEARFTPVLAEEGTLVPVMVNGVELQAQQYRVVCTELCGAGHGQMFSYVNIYQNEEDYLKAMEALWANIIDPPEDPVARGGQILASGGYGCQGCHALQADGIDWSGITGPALSGVGDRAPRRVLGLSAEEYLYRSIYYPQEFYVPGYVGVNMLQFQPNDPGGGQYMPTTDVYYITSYLCSLTSSGESACDQEALLNVINSDNPDNPVQLEAAGAGDAEETEPTEDETAPDAEAEATPEATEAAGD
jgi:cytochrome c oxidase subunit II